MTRITRITRMVRREGYLGKYYVIQNYCGTNVIPRPSPL